MTGAVCFKVTVTRANNPHVSNDGLVTVEDWKDQNLSGALIAFNRAGERLWAKHFKANIFGARILHLPAARPGRVSTLSRAVGA